MGLKRWRWRWWTVRPVLFGSVGNMSRRVKERLERRDLFTDNVEYGRYIDRVG